MENLRPCGPNFRPRRHILHPPRNRGIAGQGVFPFSAFFHTSAFHQLVRATTHALDGPAQSLPISAFERSKAVARTSLTVNWAPLNFG